MKPLLGSLAVALCAALVVTGCGATDPVAASVNGHEIDRSEFERELRALRDNDPLRASGGANLVGTGRRTVSARIASGWLNYLIADAVTAAEMTRRDVSLTKADRDFGQAQLANQFETPQVAEAFPRWFRRRLVERNARASALSRALAKTDLSEKGVQSYYDKNPDEFSQVCVSHILLESEEDVDAANARLANGEDFAAVAQEISVDQGSAPRGGDLGCNAKGVFIPEFEEVAFKADLGAPTNPVQTRFGYHILLVRSREVVPFAQAKEQARTLLVNQGRQKYGQFVQTALKKADVEIDPRYGTFGETAQGQPTVLPPKAPKPAERRPGKPTKETSEQSPKPKKSPAPTTTTSTTTTSTTTTTTTAPAG